MAGAFFVIHGGSLVSEMVSLFAFRHASVNIMIAIYTNIRRNAKGEKMNSRKFTKLSLLIVAAILLLAAVQLVSVKAENIGQTGFRTPPMSDLPHSIAVTGFRTPLMSDLPLSIAVAGFRTPAMSDLPHSISVVGFRTPPMSDLAHALSAAVSRQYEYGPAILATGFASPSWSKSFGVYPNVPWWQ
jgi:hypothetical protein